MDVRCGRCGTAYELADDKVASGTAFRCSTCGHVFMAAPQQPGGTDADAANSSLSSSDSSLSPTRVGEWLVRKPDGRVLAAQDFTTLRNWVVDRSVRREDEVSRSGRSWKRLGDIAELGSFFEVVEAAEVHARAQWLSQGGTLPPSSAEALRSVPPAALPDTTKHVRSTSRGMLVLGGVALVIACVLGVVWLRPVARVEGGPLVVGAADPEAAVVAVARAAIRSDTRDAIDAARAALAALAPTARVLAWQARLDVALASHAREEARLHEVIAQVALPGEAPPPAPAGAPAPQAGGSPSRAVVAARRRQDAASLLATAYAALTRARGEGRRLADVHLASAAYHLEKRAWVEMRADLENAQETSGGDPLVHTEVDALSALAGGTTGLRDDPRAALAGLPETMDDGRLRALRAMLVVSALVPREGAQVSPDTEFKTAKALVAALPRPDVRAELLTALLGKLELLADVQLLSLGDAGPSNLGPAAGLEGASYEVIMQRAERARLNDRSRDAWELFSLAARKKPSAPRPWLGAGWAALDIGRKAEATAAFEQALELDDALGEAWFGLAEVSNFSGKKDQARAAYRRYLELEPTGKDADVARRAIEDLE